MPKGFKDLRLASDNIDTGKLTPGLTEAALDQGRA